jgi:bacteriophage exclusion system BrxA-like protein
MYVNATPYNLSFTAASLRPELARIVAEYFLTVRDWEKTKEHILSTNALQCRSASSAERLELELRKRLETLSDEQLIVLAQANAEDRAAMAWLAACKRISFAFGFAAEALRDKLAARDTILRPSDYETYVETEAVAHPELMKLSSSTKIKIRQVLLKMLSEAGLLGAGVEWGTIQRPVLSPVARQAITSDDPRWLAGFLVPDHEIGGVGP